MSTTVIRPGIHVECIPRELQDLPQWVCWKYVDRGGKSTKVPINARFGWNANSSDPSTWATFNQALVAFEEVDDYAGIGFVFSDTDPYCGIDLDNCLDDNGQFIWGREIIERFACYTEVSPSGQGVKLYFRGRKPEYARAEVRGFGPNAEGKIEIYDRRRFFAVTGQVLPDVSVELPDRQNELDALCAELWPRQVQPDTSIKVPDPDRTERCLKSMLALRITDQNDGSFRLYTACCRCVEYNLSESEALQVVRAYGQLRPFPSQWTDAQIVKRFHDAEKVCIRGTALAAADVGIEHLVNRLIGETGNVTEDDFKPRLKSVRELLCDHPALRPPVIHGLLRQGETMNVIAASKLGKSWLVTDMALALATGRTWLDIFETVQGDVLILDNELHAETTTNRIPKVAMGRGIAIEEIADHVFVENLRGRLKDIYSLGGYFQGIEPGRFKVIILDAFYRFIPRNTDENDNGSMANIYNYLDSCAARLGCSFVLIHHTSKGNQTSKAITDVGAGAGSQSRAADTHLIMRPHERPDAVVLEAAVRSWPPVEPICLRWSFPIWTRDDTLDPTLLRPERPRRKGVVEKEPASPKLPVWDTERFVAEFAEAEPLHGLVLIEKAVRAGLSERQAQSLLKRSAALGLLYPWRQPGNRAIAYATIPQGEENPPVTVKTQRPPKREQILALIKSHPEMSKQEIASECNVSLSYVTRIYKMKDFF